MHRSKSVYIITALALFILFTSVNVFAGKLYIKPDLELKRAERLIDMADADFRNGKIHFTLSPEIALNEFKLAKEKYIQIIQILEKYGAGHYTPGDVQDFRNLINECELWLRKSQRTLDNQ